MNKRIYIDINNEVGKRSNIINPIIPYSVSDFVNDHRKLGIDLCLSSSSMAKTYSVFAGNNQMRDISQSNNYILPLATLYPGIEYDKHDIQSYFEDLLNSGIKGISLDLSKLFICNPNFFEKIYSFAEEKKLPVIVDWNTIEDKEKFFEISKKYKNLNIVVVNVNWAFKKYIFDYMKQNKNIYLGMNGFIYQGMVEEVCKEFSSKRLLFSSGYPFYDIGSVKAMLEYSNVSEREKDDISYKNAMYIFNIKNIKKLYYNFENDRIADAIDNSKNLSKELGFDVIDAHTHFISGYAESADWIGGNRDIDVLINSAKRLGINKIFTSPMDGLLYDGIVGNKVLDDAINNNSFDINGYVTANPYYTEDIEFALKKLEDEKICGLKLYPSKNLYPYDGKLYEPIIYKTIEMGKYFLLHGTPEEAKRMLEKYQNLNVLLAHSTQSYDFMDKVIELMKEYPNLYIDICNRYSINKSLEYLANNSDSKRIVFGSDCDLLSEASHIGLVGYSNLNENTKEDIMSNNIKRLTKKRKKI